MIRVVLDTNVLISALISKSSAPQKLYRAFTKQRFLLIASPLILEEVEDVINRERLIKYHKLTPKQRRIMEQLAELSYVVLGTVSSEELVVQRDPEDDKFLWCAIEGKADYIISGDHHLLDLKEYEGVKILSPHDFLTILEKNQ
ncbi:MAG: putative toxin-antitoxin system toxin component, PIN family [Candidatus Levybacteria bacterium RIFCSPHIGHO2_02_FULL_39_36]|uniref:Nucleotide-binding protein n=1 Tax=Candidatus Woesebacteria bacterium GW2011_GWA1_41_13b TaxID=1618555 RepID=A0A0G0USU3_9BACT|nr:MAG: nucleotide-binding protein [Candidatus Woesebacteria bacterium GW2011_GWA1_41_13b]OGH27885.1 MAG: putative toxin-antitoxin system toxin component, PIN family [Candidatus Levybacteria bacterium RIFCSPHIGHO2_02_FULL_39_36]OGH45555.1 MAG: putative toxin-antitoxin system toxin component, PIN family [Candidatus Levybacteria bacterium RIFCSPLOWO2_02_FULL_39_26]OGH48002.1 MAG: putative toxin-antitoxin system toxin component, PIN family [Candidatus Levybacteria bacterium RIFCSPLOWO2_12_FULL_39_1